MNSSLQSVINRVNQKKFLDKSLKSQDFVMVMYLGYLMENSGVEVRRPFRVSTSIVEVDVKVKIITQVTNVIVLSFFLT